MNLKIKLLSLVNLITEVRILLKCKKEVNLAQRRLAKQRKRVAKLRNDLKVLGKKKNSKKRGK